MTEGKQRTGPPVNAVEVARVLERSIADHHEARTFLPWDPLDVATLARWGQSWGIERSARHSWKAAARLHARRGEVVEAEKARAKAEKPGPFTEAELAEWIHARVSPWPERFTRMAEVLKEVEGKVLAREVERLDECGHPWGRVVRLFWRGARGEFSRMYGLLALCQRRGNNSSTLRRKATVIRAWARWCRKSGLVDVCKLADADLPHEHPTPIEVASMTVYLKKLEEKQPRYVDEFRVYLGSGLRRCELLNLRWGDIDLKAGVVQVKRRKDWSPKARKDRIVALTEDAKAALERICQKRKRPKSQGPYLNEDGFLTIYPTTLTHAWLDFTRAAGLPPRLHSTRHAHATEAVERGAILTDVQAQLGHARINTTMRYVKPNPAGPLRMVQLMNPKKNTAPKSRGRSASQKGSVEASV